MGKRGNADARRARKKQLKAQRRKKLVAMKKPAHGASDALWFNIVESVESKGAFWAKNPLSTSLAPLTEGLARARRLHPLHAAIRAEYLMSDGPEEASGLWTRKAAAWLTTDAILARLDAVGIYTNEAAFNEVASRYSSAWQLFREEWLPKLAAAPDARLCDFLGLAAHELWKRFRPDVPSSEMVLEPLFERVYTDDERFLTAEIDLVFWERLKRLLTPDVRTVKDVDALLAKGNTEEAVLDNDRHFSNWSMDLVYFVVVEPADFEPELAGRFAAMIAEILDRFADEGPLWKRDMNEARAHLLIAAGEQEQAERILLDIIDQHPKATSVYWTLIDLWTPPGAVDLVGLKRSLVLLKRWSTYASDTILRDRLALLIDATEEIIARFEASPSAEEPPPPPP